MTRLAGDGQPFEITIIITGLEQRFSIVIGRPIECLGADFHPRLRRIFPFETNGPVTKKLDVRAHHWRTASRVRHPPLFIATHVILDQHRIHDPDECVELIAAVHFPADPPCASLVEWHFQISARVPVFVARNELRFPARGDFTDELRGISLNEPAGDLRGIEALPVELGRVAFQKIERVLEHRLHVHGRGGELDGGGITEDQRQLRLHPSGHRLSRLEAAPVASDLSEELAAMVLSAGSVLRDGLLQHFAGLIVLAAVEKYLDQRIARCVTDELVF